MATDTYRYFAYGSNMSSARLRQRTPSARAMCKARLPHHVLRWHKLGRDGSGKCDIEYAGDESADCVWGVLFEISRAEKVLLDRVEGLGIGYVDKQVRVQTEAGEMLATTYQAMPQMVDSNLRPQRWYKDHVLRGAREHDLPPLYIERIEGIDTVP